MAVADLSTGWMFDGRRKASRLTLLGRTAEMIDDPRVLRRLQIVHEAATLVAACHWEDPYTAVRRAKPPLEYALEDDMAVVREAGILLLEQMARYAVHGGAYDVALPLLDQSVALGPSFAVQHLRRWRARLALDEASAAEDWSQFVESVSKVAELSGEPSWELVRDVMWIDGHLEAAHAAIAQRDGWPTAKVKRDRAKKAKPPKPARAKHHEARRARLVAEATHRVAQLPDPFVLPLHFETRHVRLNGLSQFEAMVDRVS